MLNIKVVVTKHVVQRLKERFYARFYNNFHSFEMTKNLIHAQVSTGVVLQDWKPNMGRVLKLF
jgi:hypothetical protein